MSDSDIEEFGGTFVDGHWEWDETVESLVWIQDREPSVINVFKPNLLHATSNKIEFKVDVDLLEQQRFRKYYQRKLKPGDSEPDVITLQDIKDIVIFTAPLIILTPSLIDVLHRPTTERFLRALMFYSQYYLQISDLMANRVLELDNKIRTPESDIIEGIYRDNLSDLRILIANEYGNMLLGSGEMKKFHHLGPNKKLKSLSAKDANLYESLIRMSIQIVWIGLGRKGFSVLEVEINRIMKSEIYNSVEHRIRTNWIKNMSHYERDTLLGTCVHRHDSKLNANSPVMNDALCLQRGFDNRIIGLGSVNFKLSKRLRYMYMAIAGPEEELAEEGVTVGLLGLPRKEFDTMLNVIVIPETPKSSQKSVSTIIAEKKSCTSDKKSVASTAYNKIYPDIILPMGKKEETGSIDTFPAGGPPVRRSNEKQLRRWQTRLRKLIRPHLLKHKASVSSQNPRYSQYSVLNIGTPA